MNEEQARKFFVSPGERLVAVLGQGIIASVIQGNIGRGVILLSNERLYQKGFFFNGYGKSFSGEAIVRVKDVTGTRFVTINNPKLLFFFFLIIPVILFFLLRKRIFFIEYAGGAIGVDTNWYSPEEIRNFQRAIYQLQDRYGNG